MHQRTNKQRRQRIERAADLTGQLPNQYNAYKVRQFFSIAPTNEQSFLTESVKKMEQKKEKITRDCLRAMKIGDTVVVQCKDGYDMDSQKNTAYAMQKMENCRFACKSDGLTLTVTKHGNS